MTQAGVLWELLPTCHRSGRAVPGTGGVAPIKVVVNWKEELNRLVPNGD